MRQNHNNQQDGVSTERTNTGEESSALLGEAVLVDGLDAQAARRAHMRDLTTARQAVERDRLRPLDLPPEATSATRQEARQKRGREAGEALANIEATHQVWLRSQGPPSGAEQQAK